MISLVTFCTPVLSLPSFFYHLKTTTSKSSTRSLYIIFFKPGIILMNRRCTFSAQIFILLLVRAHEAFRQWYHNIISLDLCRILACYSLKFVRTVLFANFAYAKIYVRKAIHETFLRTKNRKSVRKYTNGLSCRTTEIFRKYGG